MNDSSHPVAQRNITAVTETHFIPPVGRHQFPGDRRQSIRIVRPSGSFQGHPLGFKDPVYVLDPQKPHGSPQNDIVGLDSSRRVQSIPTYPSQWLQNANFEGQNSRDVRGDLQNANTTYVVSNDARLHYDNRPSRPECGAPTTIPWHPKHTARKVSWQEKGSNRDNTVFVAGFLVESPARQWLEELFSVCGDIIHLHVLDLKPCAFIT
jgi:hypothetical protein